ncbi:hypothetical protein KFE25_003087 [Diacronema lutheri]|uniref:Uncharacterized protein n=2 Tax=Diacronema lutheri TaxID=2081491 RepID=A0A8J5XDB7_DIALT|nr:hypothetical protein KFE25_003087 [Diacronema lutheri]
MPGKKKPQPRAQFFAALRDDKGTRALDTIRWCLRHGGVNVRAEDDDGHTAVHIAAAGNKLEILQALVDHVKQAGAPDDLDVADVEGRTALMMAAFKGAVDACKILSVGGASWAAKCDEGLTARDYAAKRGSAALVAMFDGGLPALLKERAAAAAHAVAGNDEPSAADDEAKAKKWRMAQLDANKQAEREAAVYEARLKEREHVESTLETAPKAVWPEVQAAIDSKGRELSISRDCAELDPAIWWCITLNSLRVRAETGALARLPAELRMLGGLTSLIVSHCGLEALPPQLGELGRLRVLEAVGNRLRALPDELARCHALEVLALGHNELSSADVLARLPALTTVNLDRNRLDALPIPPGEHLRSLSAADNAIAAIGAGVGQLQALRELTLTNNQIDELPVELAELQPKVLQVVALAGNPIRDPRIRRFIEDARPSLVKDLLAHVRKHGVSAASRTGGGGGGGGGGGVASCGGGGAKKKGKGKGKAAAEEDEPADADDGDLSALLAQINGED